MQVFADLTQFRVSLADFVAVVTMDNPPVNAQARVFHEEAMRVFDTLSDLDDCRAIVLTGAGKCFSAGADIKGRAGKTPEAGDLWQHNRRARECYHSITECRKPVIAAINGAALGAGLAFVPAHHRVGARRHVVDAEAAVGVGDTEVRMVEDDDERRHV